MKVVIVDGDVSYPPTSGKRLRTLNLMVRLAGRHQITYVGRGRAGSAETLQAREYLADHGIKPIVVDDPVPRKEGIGFYVRLAANLFSALPYSVAAHASAAMRQTVMSHAARHAVDLWQFEWLPYMSCLQAPPQVPRLVIAHNVDTLIWQRYCENAKGGLRRCYLKQQWRKFERFERRAFARASRVVAVSAEDARLIREQFGMPRVDVVDNGVDPAYFGNVTGRRDPSRILFLGALDWRPNLDAVDLLLGKIFPAVRAQEPAARLVLVGRSPPLALRQRVAGMDNVELHADVPDVRVFLGDCGVMTVPLRVGGGSRLKILEALACGLPVASSRVGAEGLTLKAGQDYVLAEEDDMAQALVQMMRYPREAGALAEHGRRVVLERYDWDVLARKLEAVWEKCLAGPPPLSLPTHDRLERVLVSEE